MRAVLLVSALALITTVVAASSYEYVNEPILGCDEGSGVSGHVVCIRESSPFTITINDDVSPSTSAFYCEDWNADSICGDDGTFGAVEPGVWFCGVLGVDSPAQGAGFVFLDGPVNGNPAFSVCGSLSMATHGFVVVT